MTSSNNRDNFKAIINTIANTSNNVGKEKHSNTCNSLKKVKLLLKKYNKVDHFGEAILHIKKNSIHYSLEICLMIVTCMNYSDYVVPIISMKTQTFKCCCLEIQENEECLLTNQCQNM